MPFPKRPVLCGTALLLCACVLVLLWWVSRPCPAPLEGVSFSRCIWDREGGLMRMGLAQDGRYRLKTRLQDLPEAAIAAVLHYEDRFFWSHPGVNVFSLVRACASMLTGGRRMGGSTLTMQVVRLRMGLRTGSLADKIRQMLWALRLEWHHDKAEILQAYFCLAPYGGNVEGLEAAARVYFHKKAAQLTATELLSLIPVPQNPVLRTPSPDNELFLQAAARLQRDYARTGKAALPVAVRPSALRIYSLRDLPFRAPHVSSELMRRPGPETDVHTTIDPLLQSLLEEHLRSFTRRSASYGLRNAAALLVHWPDREVRALAGSADFFAQDIQGQIDATSVRRSPGSTLKPFIYALALQQGLIHPRTLLTDLPRNFAGYEPENFDGTFQGPLPADAALRLSRNVPAIALARDLRAPGLYGFLQRAHVRFDFSEEHYGLSLVLGGAEVSARELATLYAMLCDNGIWKPLQLCREEGQAPAGERLLSAEAAFVTRAMLTGEDGGSMLRSRYGALIPLRYKTGTSNGLRDAWTCGFFGPYVLVVWLGNCDNTSNPLLVGARTALPLFREISRSLAAADPMEDRFAQPAPDCRVEQIQVCAATGDVDLSLCPAPEDQASTWFIPGVSPVKDSGILRRVRINPRTGLRSCPEDPEPGELRVVEFWPSELRQLFLRAGISKPAPPDFGPLCARQKPETQQAPRIILPKEGMIYHVQGTRTDCTIPLLAHADAEAAQLYWFVDSDYAGTSTPGQPLLVQELPGDHIVRVVDDRGRSARRQLSIRRMP